MIMSSKQYYFLAQERNVMVGKSAGQRKLKTGVVHGFRENVVLRNSECRIWRLPLITGRPIFSSAISF